MSTFKTFAIAAALTGFAGLSSMAIAQTAGTEHSQQHNSSQDQSTRHPQPQAQHDQVQGVMPGTMQGQSMQSMMEMMHSMMHGQGMGGHGATVTAVRNDESPASLALKAVNEKMHRDMTVALSGNPDVDFAKAMIAHHQGAIDMSKVVLAFGQDPDVRQLAEAIIKAQESEIAFLRDWLQKNGR